MSCLALFAAVVPDWLRTWLTPIWLLGVGALAGLVLVLLGWLVLLALSRVWGMAVLDENARVRRRVVLAVAVVLFVALSPLALNVGPVVWTTAGAAGRIASALALLAAALAISFVVIRLASPKAVAEIPMAVREGVLWPLLILIASLACFGVVGAALVEKPGDVLASVGRLPFAGRQQLSFDIPGVSSVPAGDVPAEPPACPIRVSFRRSELRKLVFFSRESLTVTTTPDEAAALLESAIRVPAGQEFAWIHRRAATSPFEAELVEKLYVRNRAFEPTRLRLTVFTEPAHPQVVAIGFVAVFVMALLVLYLLQRTTMPKVSAVALATLKSDIAQPLFAIILSLGLLFLALSLFIPYHTFGEDIKMLKDSGLTLITVLCTIQAVWAAGTSIAEEIEGRTALTVLSKPITRRSYVVGKFLGIVWTLALMFIVLGFVFLIVVAYKPVYDAKESPRTMPGWETSYSQMVNAAPGLALGFMETATLAALSVAISTRLPLLANFVICFSVYVLGHLTPLIVQASFEGFEVVKFVGRLIATVFPNLEFFNIQAAVAADIAVPYEYLIGSLIYCLIYTLIAMLLALVMFEDRDLA